MNLCLLGTIGTGVETLRARVEYNMERGASEFCSEWTLADTGNNGFVWLGNITDMDGMSAFLTLPKKRSGTVTTDVFIKSTPCPKCLDEEARSFK